tara:strand:+ start:959 stop:1138 length:180 start_codon:yes stop_codon:yes gene_type:complete
MKKLFFKGKTPDAVVWFFIIQIIIFILCRWIWGDDLPIYLRFLYAIIFVSHLGWALGRK